MRAAPSRGAFCRRSGSIQVPTESSKRSSLSSPARSLLMSKLRIPVTEKDHIRGPMRAPVTLVEYGDFQCPFCGEAFWILREIEDRFDRQLRFVYRHFPLAEIHPYAPLAAEASEA